MGFLFDDEPQKRKVPPKVLRRLVWERDQGRCRICGKEVDRWDWELGHDKAHSRGGRLTLANTFVVHSSCNRSQSTRSVRELHRMLGIAPARNEVKDELRKLTVFQLRQLAKSHKLPVKGRVEEGLFESRTLAPSKQKFVNALAKVVSKDEIARVAELKPEPKKRKRRKESSWW